MRLPRPWVVLGAVAFANLVVAALHFGLAAAAPSVRESLALDTGALGMVLAAPALGLMAGTYGWGVLADRVSERRVLSAAFLGFSCAALGASWAASSVDAVAFGAALFVSGVFASAAHSAGGRVISAAFPPARHGLVLSIRHVAIPVGGAVGGVLVPLVIEQHSLSGATTTCALLGLVAALALAVAIPSSRRPGSVTSRSADAVVRGGSPLRVGRMWVLAIGAACLAFVQLGIASFLTVQLVDRGGLQLAEAAAIFAAAQLAGAGGRIVLGLWSDRTRDRAIVLRNVGIVALACVGASQVVGPLAEGLLLAIALVVVTSCNGVVVAIAATQAPRGRIGATLGMQTTANAAACTVAPILLGLLIVHGGWSWFGAMLVLVLVVGTVLLSRLAVIRLRDDPAHPIVP